MALFLDIDGTLMNMDTTPEATNIFANLGNVLHDIYQKLGGALALVTGRSIAHVDALIGKSLPIAGLHGAEIRDSKGKLHHFPQPQRFMEAKRFLMRETQKIEDLQFEDKGMTVAVVFGQDAPLQSIASELAIKALKIAGPNYTVQRGKTMVEFKPAFCDNGRALHFFMQQNAFASRTPICFGDGSTDDSMFITAQNYNGVSVCIGRPSHKTAARFVLSTAESLKDWLENDLR